MGRRLGKWVAVQVANAGIAAASTQGCRGVGLFVGAHGKGGGRADAQGGGLYRACAQCAAQEWCKASLEGIVRCRESGGVRVGWAGGRRRAQGAGHSSTVKHRGTTESQSIVALQRESSQLRRGEWVSRRGGWGKGAEGQRRRGALAQLAGSARGRRSPGCCGQQAGGAAPSTRLALARATHIG